jgi:hypothetical protein
MKPSPRSAHPLPQPVTAVSTSVFPEPETDIRRNARVNLAHRKALHDLAWVTLRYQVHNELAELRESETRIRARARAR